MLRQIDDSVKSWQQPGMQRRLVFALLGVLIALSYALLLPSEEAQAKEGKHSPNEGSVEGAIGGSVQPVQEVAGEVNKLAGNEEAGGKEAGSVAARNSAPLADKPTPVDDRTVRDAARSTTKQVVDKVPSTVDPAPKTNPPIVERTGSLEEATGTAREATKTAVQPTLDEATSVARPTLEGETKLPRADPRRGYEEAVGGRTDPRRDSQARDSTDPEQGSVGDRADFGESNGTGPAGTRGDDPYGRTTPGHGKLEDQAGPGESDSTG